MIDVAWEHAAGDSSPKKFFVCLDVDGVFGAAESNVFLPFRESDGDVICHA